MEHAIIIRFSYENSILYKMYENSDSTLFTHINKFLYKPLSREMTIYNRKRKEISYVFIVKIYTLHKSSFT